MRALSDLQEGQTQITAFQYYELMLETCERLFDDQVEQLIFKDQMREMLGCVQVFLLILLGYHLTRVQDAYKIFTIDRILASLIKHRGLGRIREVPLMGMVYIDTAWCQSHTFLRINSCRLRVLW